jgi:Domain of unknown function (DUF6471)
MPANASGEEPEKPAASEKAGRSRSAWNGHAKRLLQAEMAKHGVSYKQLARLLQEGGRADSDASLMTRINRGTFSMAFFLQAVRVMGTKSFDISHISADAEGRARGRK